MKPATHFLICFALSINNFANLLVSAAFTSLSGIEALSGDVPTTYIVELESTASSGGSKKKRRSLTVRITFFPLLGILLVTLLVTEL